MKQKYLVERVMNAIFFVCGLTAIACVVLISVYMIIAGVPAIGKIGLLSKEIKKPFIRDGQNR